jgi:hypothetical protein
MDISFDNLLSKFGQVPEITNEQAEFVDQFFLLVASQSEECEQLVQNILSKRYGNIGSRLKFSEIKKGYEGIGTEEEYSQILQEIVDALPEKTLSGLASLLSLQILTTGLIEGKESFSYVEEDNKTVSVQFDGGLGVLAGACHLKGIDYNKIFTCQLATSLEWNKIQKGRTENEEISEK